MAASTPQDVPNHELDEHRLEDLRDILSPTKLRLLQQILASPTGALSSKELAARNTISDSTIRDHLRDLHNRDTQIVAKLEPDTSPVPNGIPRVYFAVTEYGISLLKQADLYDQIGLLYDMYEAVDLQLPDADNQPVTLDEIENYDHRPTPDWL
ncbi:hypothetical protein [Halomicrococcus sp. NG-SE-24]|uniref:hypothetical protein n=1 Tax=Halomicrococcus sp. NG-SE-24 TaxID=3436928 RepID=UPI003D96BF57